MLPKMVDGLNFYRDDVLGIKYDLAIIHDNLICNMFVMKLHRLIIINIVHFIYR